MKNKKKNDSINVNQTIKNNKNTLNARIVFNNPDNIPNGENVLNKRVTFFNKVKPNL